MENNPTPVPAALSAEEMPLPVGAWVLRHKLSESEKLVPPQMTANGMYYHYQQVTAMMKEYANDQVKAAVEGKHKELILRKADIKQLEFRVKCLLETLEDYEREVKAQQQKIAELESHEAE